MTTDRSGPRILIASDLDATLLHEETYDAGNVQPLLVFLAERNVPLILASSKTRREIREIQAALGIRSPFICENGGAIVFPPGELPGWEGGERIGEETLVVLGPSVEVLREALSRFSAASRLRVRSILEMTVEEVVEITGLFSDKAQLAREREYSLPFRGEGTEAQWAAFRQAVERDGFRLTRGGRLHHLLGEADKAAAVARLRADCESPGVSCFIVALGDAENDLEMLRQADAAVVIPKKAGWDPQLIQLEHVRRAPHPAPEGWIEAVRNVLIEQGFNPP